MQWLAAPEMMQPNSHMDNVAWSTIYLYFESFSLNCTFNLDDKNKGYMGSANLDISVRSDEAEATNVQNDQAYIVTVTPDENIEAQNMSISIPSA